MNKGPKGLKRPKGHLGIENIVRFFGKVPGFGLFCPLSPLKKSSFSGYFIL